MQKSLQLQKPKKQILALQRAITLTQMMGSGLFSERNQTLMYIQLLVKFSKHRIINDNFIVFTRSFIAILPILKGHNPVTNKWIWLVFEKNGALIDIQLLYKFGKCKITNEDFIVLTRSIIAILTNSRAIIPSCINGPGWFSKGTKLLLISSYCINLVNVG